MIKDGSVEIETVKHWYNTSDFSQSYKFKANPYEYIKVRFETDLQIGGSGFVAGKDYMLPALYVYLLFSNDTKQKWITTGKIAVDVAVMALGSAEIVAASRAGSVGGFVLGAIDMGLGVGDIVLNQAYHNEIIAAYPESGEAFCSSWQTISMCYGIGRLSIEGLLADVNIARKFAKANKNNPELSPATRKFVDDVDEKLNGPEFARFADDVDNILAGIRAKFTRCGCANELNDFLVLRIRDKLTDAEIAKLDIELAGNSTLKNALNSDQELVDVWKDIEHLTSFRGEAKFLQALKKVKVEFNDLIDKHIFKGDIKKTLNADGTTTFGNAGGGHHISAVSDNPPYRTGDIQIISTANSNSANGLKECKIRVYDEDLYLYHQRNYNPNTNVPDRAFWGWKTKSKNSTLFPDSWTKGKMQEEVALAWSNKGSTIPIVSGANVYEGICSEGFKIQFLERNGIIETIFPIL